jgi:hypothetical protein
VPGSPFLANITSSSWKENISDVAMQSSTRNKDIYGIVANSVKVKCSDNVIFQSGWTKPATGVYKLNVDAAYDIDTGRVASGAIIRDSSENFIAACCDYMDYAIDASAMEALALLAVAGL